MRDPQELIGRADVDDLDAVLAMVNRDPDAAQTTVASDLRRHFTWDYELARQPLARLYEKAKAPQWNASDLPWDTEVDQERTALAKRR